MVPGNARRGRPQGKCHRKQTAPLRAHALRRVRVKRCGKSAPRSWQQERQGKPHQEQRQIGVAYGPFPARHPGRRREASGNGRPRGMVIHLPQGRGQNPAYRPSGSFHPSFRKRHQISWRLSFLKRKLVDRSVSILISYEPSHIIRCAVMHSSNAT